MAQPSDDVCLQEQLKRFWELEEAEKVFTESESDIYCEQFYKKTTLQQQDGKYVARLPFKKKFPRDIFLGPSRSMTLAQYFRMEKALSKNMELKEEYSR